jgi:hypothetical protein
MKKLILLLIVFYQGFCFSQDTTQVKHTEKISNLVKKVNGINEEHLSNKEQVMNKSKIDGLMLKIESIKKEEIVTSKERTKDSLLLIIQNLNSINLQKDSLIASLKKQLSNPIIYNQEISNTTSKQLNNNPHKYIVLGAYQYKSNAENQVKKLREYDVEMTSTYWNKLHYVVYKLKSKEKIATTLSKFRNKVEPNAWYIAF